MFSREYLTNLAGKTGFRPDSLQKQMTLLDLLREVNRHPLLGKQFALKGGTAINLFYFQLPRLSVDIDLNYIGSAEREVMLKDRPMVEQEMKKLIESKRSRIPWTRIMFLIATSFQSKSCSPERSRR